MSTAVRPSGAAPKRRASGLRTTLFDVWGALTADLLSAYHPEKHYMRGPGPKWHERHAHSETFAARPTALDEYYPAP